MCAHHLTPIQPLFFSANYIGCTMYLEIHRLKYALFDNRELNSNQWVILRCLAPSMQQENFQYSLFFPSLEKQLLIALPIFAAQNAMPPKFPIVVLDKQIAGHFLIQ